LLLVQACNIIARKSGNGCNRVPAADCIHMKESVRIIRSTCRLSEIPATPYQP